jgi:two-component sensor histidine kinase
VTDAFESGQIVDSAAPDWYEETPTRVRAVPVLRRLSASGTGDDEAPIAVITKHTNLSEARTPSRQELTFNECANELFRMIASGDFPDLGRPGRSAPRGAPRIRRPRAPRCRRQRHLREPQRSLGVQPHGVLGRARGGVARRGHDPLLSGKLVVDESLPLVVTGRAPWRTDIEARGVTVSLRAIPIRDRGERVGAIVLCRDVTELRHQERELITKDATIREIHHRVKNNLQTVASLLRIQARRSHSDEARESLSQAMRRVEAIAVVHDTLSEGLAERRLRCRLRAGALLIAEVASNHNTKATRSSPAASASCRAPTRPRSRSPSPSS